MGATEQRVKTGAGRAKAQRARAREAPEAALDAIFDALPDPLAANGGVPEVVRQNRRGRAKRRLLEAIQSRGPYPVPEARWIEVRTLAQRWAQKDFDDGFTEVVDFEVRCAEERAVLDAENRGDEEERFAAAERAYRRLVVERHGRIEIRGLQLSARVHQDLEIAYVPLHVEDASEAPPLPKVGKRAAGKKPKGGAKAKQGDIEAVMAMVRAVDRPRIPATRALAKHPRLLVVGGPGSGKSTLAAFLATRAARGELASELGWTEDPVPFLVPVRALREAPATLESLASAAGAEPSLFEAALRRGRALLLIDGLDEARREVAPEILPALTAILDAHPRTRALVTTRPAGAPGNDEPAPPGFARVDLTPMIRDEVSDFIEKWCLAAELSLGKAREHAETDARIAAEDLEDRVRSRRAIEKLAQTPLLCSVICIVHRFLGQQIPERRVALYEAITNVLLYEWDWAKFPEGAAIGKLDAAAKRALLARLARAMHEAKVAELPEEEVVKRFAAQLPDLGRPAGEAAAIVAEIRDRNGVLVERAPGSFAFSHLAFQEYLTALETVNARAYDLLLANYKDKWWHEVVVLAAGFPSADAARIVRGLLDKDGEGIAEGTMLAAQCAETAVELPSCLRSEIEERVRLLVPPKDDADLERLTKIGELAGPTLLKHLATADVNGKAAILWALSLISYAPAIGFMLKLMRDPSRTTKTTLYGNAGVSLTEAALAALVKMAVDSRAAYDALMAEQSADFPTDAGEMIARVQAAVAPLYPTDTIYFSSTAETKRAARSG